MISVKKKYGKNAMLKGMNLEEEMCIRDRYRNYLRLLREFYNADCVAVIYNGESAWDTLEEIHIPVSYTHLDVYKRQG